MENVDFLPPTAPSLVFVRETYTPYRTFHVYQHVTSLSRMRIAPVGKTRRAANQPSQQRLVVMLQ